MIISKIPFISTYLFTILGSLIFILKTSRNQGTLYIKWPLVVNEHKSLLDSEISIHVTHTKHNYCIYANLECTLFEVFWIPKTGCTLVSMAHQMRTLSQKLRFRCRLGRNLFSFAHCARVNMTGYCAKLQYSNRMDKQRRFSYTEKCKRKVILLAEKEGKRQCCT